MTNRSLAYTTIGKLIQITITANHKNVFAVNGREFYEKVEVITGFVKAYSVTYNENTKVEQHMVNISGIGKRVIKSGKTSECDSIDYDFFVIDPEGE
jgi:hypothetical protein